jgi:hypothetical protein
METVNGLIELLGEKRVEKVKDEIAEILIERLRDDLDSWGEYLFYPPDFSDIYGQAVKEAEKKIKKIYVDKLVQQGLEQLKGENGNEK